MWVSPGVSAGVQVAADPPPSVGGLLECVGYLARRHAITGDLLSKFSATNRPSREKERRDFWDLTELPAEEFTDEVARFYKLAVCICRGCLRRHPLPSSFLSFSFGRWRFFPAA